MVLSVGKGRFWVMEDNMTDLAFIADLERLEAEIDEALLHCPGDDSLMFAELRLRQSHLKEEIKRLRHEALGSKTLH